MAVHPLHRTETAEFKRWFKKSKVVDADGKPLVVYHGTQRSGFDTFDRREIDDHHIGFFFTDSQKMAASYSRGRKFDVSAPLSFKNLKELEAWIYSNDPRASRFHLYERVEDFHDNDGNPTGEQYRYWILEDRGTEEEFYRARELLAHVAREASKHPSYGLYPVYLSFQDPLIVDAAGATWQAIPKTQIRKVPQQILDKYRLFLKTDDVCAIAEEAGHDSVIIRNCIDYGPHGAQTFEPATVFVAFNSTQIKSAFHNSGAYDPYHPNIRNPADRAYKVKLGEGHASAAWAKKDLSAVELVTKDEVYKKHGGGQDVDFAKVFLELARRNLDSHPQAQAMLPVFEPVRIEQQGNRYEFLFWSPYYLPYSRRKTLQGQPPTQTELTAWQGREAAFLNSSFARVVRALKSLAVLKPEDAEAAAAKAKLKPQDLEMYHSALYALHMVAETVKGYGLNYKLDLRDDNLAVGPDGGLILLDPIVTSVPIQQALEIWDSLKLPRKGKRNPAGPWIPPPAVAAAAKKGAALRAKQPKSNQCCMATGIARAKQLSSRSPVSYKDLVTMRAWFARHAVDARGKGWGKNSKGWQAFLMWGGQPGKEWCEALLRRMGA